MKIFKPISLKINLLVIIIWHNINTKIIRKMILMMRSTNLQWIFNLLYLENLLTIKIINLRLNLSQEKVNFLYNKKMLFGYLEECF